MAPSSVKKKKKRKTKKTKSRSGSTSTRRPKRDGSKAGRSRSGPKSEKRSRKDARRKKKPDSGKGRSGSTRKSGVKVAKPRPFTVRKSKIQGRGGFANRWIPAGTTIIEYKGERIPEDVADSRYDDDGMRRHHTFLFAVDDGIVIDAAVGGNSARFINHSCDPNCEAVDYDGRIYIEALRDIAPGEELFYDYAYDLDEKLTPSLKRQYPCYCGSKKCRGTILVGKD